MRRCLPRTILFVGFLVFAIPFTLWAVPRALNPTPPTEEETKRDIAWVKSSPYWLDRQACWWLTLCGLHHVRRDFATLAEREHYDKSMAGRQSELRRRTSVTPSVSHGAATKGSNGGREHAKQSRTKQRIARPGQSESPARSSRSTPRPIPQYVLDHAPLVHLYSGERFWPSDMAEHIRHMIPVTSDGVPINLTAPLSLDTLAQLNNITGDRMALLRSVDDVETRPDWLHSHTNIPTKFPDNSSNNNKSGNGAGKHDTFYVDPAADEWSWFDVDHDHPLHGISDPRRLRDFNEEDGASLPGRASNRQPQRPQRRARSATTSNSAAEEDPTQQQRLVSPTTDFASTFGKKPDQHGYSSAPAVLLLVPKGPHILDAFWFFFYSYNLGQTVGNIRFGNHVGDWEHCMVRFEDGIPRAVFMSEHAGGQAYAWDAVEKRRVPRLHVVPPPAAGHNGGVTTATTTRVNDEEPRLVERFVVYSAVGSHAMYPSPGDHPYVLPFNMLRDQTDRGPLWDPARNIYSYHHDYRANSSAADFSDDTNCRDENAADDDANDDIESPPHHSRSHTPDFSSSFSCFSSAHAYLEPTSSNPNAPTNWFHYLGPWGDETYPLRDERQYRLFGQYHYVTGPLGPARKYLERHKVCQTEHCVVLHRISGDAKWY